MQISAQANIIAENLQRWIETEKGKAVVVNDMSHMWEVAFQQTQWPRALVCYMGDSLRGDFSVAAALGRSDRQWCVALVRGTGFGATRGDGLSKQVGNGRAFYDQVEECRDVIRCMRNVSVELPVDFLGIEPMANLEDYMSGYLIKFSTAVDLPQMTVGTMDGSDGSNIVLPP